MRFDELPSLNVISELFKLLLSLFM